MGREKLFEDELYNIGSYGFGRMGYRPVISLPGDHAKALSQSKEYVEILGIIAFIFALVLFLLTVVGIETPVLIGGLVIGFRSTVILLDSLVVAKTVIREPSSHQISGDRITDSTALFHVQAQVRNSDLHMIIENKSATTIFLSIKIQSNSGTIDIHRVDEPIILKYTEEKELVIPLDAKEFETGDPDEILSARIEYSHTMQHFNIESRRMLLGEFDIPITVSTSDVISSEVIEYEVLKE